MKALIVVLGVSLAMLASGAQEYVFAYFSDFPWGGRRGEAAGLHLAWSADGLKWKALNDDRPVLIPELGPYRLLRDPSLAQGRDGVFHLVWTTGWKDNIIGHATSTDLIHWSRQEAIPVMADEPTTRNCWAPEVTYVAEEDLFYIYWSSTIPGRHSAIAGMDSAESGLNHRIYLTTTRDWKNFSKTRLWFNPDFSVIDATLARDPQNGDWLLFYKNENHTPPKKHICMARTQRLADGFSADGAHVLTHSWTEGPSALFVGNTLYLYYDCYKVHCYGAKRSTDGGNTWQDLDKEFTVPAGMRHGTAIAVDSSLLEVAKNAQVVLSAAVPEGQSKPPADVTMLEIKMSAEKLNALGEYVRITGEVRDLVRGADDVQLLVNDWHGEFVAVVPMAESAKVPDDWGIGARVRVAGVLFYKHPEGRDFRLFPRGAEEVEVLSPPPFWTTARVAWAALVMLLVIFAALGWAMFLRYQRSEESRTNDVVQKERLRLSRDLHDGYQQLLAGCMFRLTATITLLQRAPSLSGDELAACRRKISEQLNGLRSSLTHAQDELRAALWTMTEEAEGPAALVELFKYASARLPHWEGKVTCETVGNEKPVARRFAGALLMILQEAVGNALRHGKAEKVRVSFVFGRRGFAMIVHDDGCGFDVDAAEAASDGFHLGLASMRTRAEKIGGRLAVRSWPGTGSEVKILVEDEK